MTFLIMCLIMCLITFLIRCLITCLITCAPLINNRILCRHRTECAITPTKLIIPTVANCIWVHAGAERYNLHIFCSRGKRERVAYTLIGEKAI